MNDKLILVFYLNVDGIEHEDVKLYISQFRDSVTSDSYHSFIIPVINQETRVDCINPKYVDKEEWHKHLKALKQASDTFTRFAKKFEEKPV